MVPAAVIIIGHTAAARRRRAAPPCSRRRWPCDESTSMLCARVMRGNSSSEKTPRPARRARRRRPACRADRRGRRHTGPCNEHFRLFARCSGFAPGVRTCSSRSALPASSWREPATVAPCFSYSASGNPASTPAPRSRQHLESELLQGRYAAGDDRHAALAGKGFLGDSRNHGVAILPSPACTRLPACRVTSPGTSSLAPA